MPNRRFVQVTRVSLGVAFVFSLFTPWAWTQGDLLMGSIEIRGLWFVALMPLFDPKILCLPMYFILNFWLGQGNLWLLVCRLVLSGVSFYLLLSYTWSSYLFSQIEWGYWFILLTLGGGIGTELFLLPFFLKCKGIQPSSGSDEQ